MPNRENGKQFKFKTYHVIHLVVGIENKSLVFACTLPPLPFFFISFSLSFFSSHFFMIVDPRAQNYMFMDNPLPTLGMCVTYLAWVLIIGPIYMRDRKPMDIKNIIIFYNAFQVALSTYMFYEVSVLLRVNDDQPKWLLIFHMFAAVVDVYSSRSSRINPLFPLHFSLTSVNFIENHNDALALLLFNNSSSIIIIIIY